jgi:hypothetical protein
MLKCGDCIYYSAQTKPIKSGGRIDLKRGYCLKHSTFATNRPDSSSIPPGAISKELPFGRHDIQLVRNTEIKLNCPDGKSRD